MSVAETLIPPQPAPKDIAKPLSVARVTGTVLVLIWLALAATLIYMVIAGWDPEKFTRYGPRYLHGLMTTVILVTISVICGAVLSLPLAFARMSPNRILSGFAYCYVYVFRGTPLLAQLFLIYYGLGQFRPQLEAVGLWWFFRDAWYCGLFSMTINTAAYQAEILRGAIQSIPRGQFEGALALGLHRWATLRRVVLPQAMILALRPLGNELIVMIKASAIASLVTLFDLMGATRLAFARSFDLSIYLYAALIYLVLTEIIRRVWDRIEIRLTRHMALR